MVYFRQSLPKLPRHKKAKGHAALLYGLPSNHVYGHPKAELLEKAVGVLALCVAPVSAMSDTSNICFLSFIDTDRCILNEFVLSKSDE